MGDANDLPFSIGRFEILRELGRGGFGVVFLASDPHLNRLVALKIPRAETLLDEEKLQRFSSEAATAAGLDHPVIVPIYEAESTGPTSYIASAYCDGPDLRQWLAKHEKADNWKAAAALVATLAEGVQYAHSKGVTHRDIKPSNVLLARKDSEDANKVAPTIDGPLDQFEPRLTDFGLAKLAESSLHDTRSSMMLGTPHYMAPEQIEGRVDGDQIAAIDIYALGCLLFELLSSRTPFEGSNYVELLDKLRNEEPARLRDLNPSVPRDLETICLKCLESSPDYRYASAEALAQDLRHIVAGEPIAARPLGRFKRSARWMRRHRVAVSLLALSMVGAVGLSLVSLWYSDRLESVQSVAQELQQEVNSREGQTRRRHYVSQLQQAGKFWNQINLGDLERTLTSLIPAEGEEDLRSFVWHYLWQRCHMQLTTYRGHEGIVSCIAISPDGKRIATGGHDGTARLYATESGRELGVLRDHQDEVNCITFVEDGKMLLTGDSGGFLRLWNTESFEQEKVVQADAEDLLCLAATPNGQVLATGGVEGIIRLWSLPKLSEIGSIEKEFDWIRSLKFSPDGGRLAFGVNDKSARIWDWQEQEQSHGYLGHEYWVTSVDFHPKGEILVSGSADRHVWLWDATRSDVTKSMYESQSLGERIRTVCYSPRWQVLGHCGQFQPCRDLEP